MQIINKKAARAIAKMTTQWALDMGALKIFRDYLTTPMATLPKILWAFVPMVPSKGTMVSSYRPALSTYFSSMSTRLLKILDCSFEWGLRTPNLGEVWGWEW